MRDIWMLVPVLFPLIFGGALWIWQPKKEKLRMAAAVLSVAEAVLSWVSIFNCMGMRLSLWTIGPGMELCLKLDGIGALFSGLASFIWMLVVFFAFEYMEQEKEEVRFFGCLIMSLGALTGVAYAGNFVTLYLFFEMMTFLSVPLVFHSRKREALQAGMVYLAYSMLGASIALGGYFFFSQYAFGTDFAAGGVLAGNTAAAGTSGAGTLGNAAAGFNKAAAGREGPGQAVLLSVFCMAAGFSCKAGLMPLHAWLPIAHPVAPAPASAVLSGLITKAGVVAVIRVVYDMAGPGSLRGTWVQYALLSMAVLTIFTGSMLAYKEKKLKKRLAYSSFSQVSYVLFGIFLLSAQGLYGSMLQMVFHALAKNALFLCAGAVICKTGCTRVKEMRGMGKRMPAVMVCFTLASLSLVGIPPAGGFLAKWHLAVGAMRTDTGLFTWLGPLVLMVSALLTAGYLFPIIVEGFFPGREWSEEMGSGSAGPAAGTLSVSLFMRGPLLILACGLLLLGAVGTPLFEFLRGIASGMV